LLFNYIKVTFRNLLRLKFFSAINIFGLSVSLASCLLLFLHAQQELSYDKNHGKRVFRLASRMQYSDGSVINYGTASVAVAPVVVEEIPEIISAAQLASAGFYLANDLITYENESFYIENGAIADSSIFKLFKFDIISGNSQMPLAHNNAVALEKVWAEKLFGETSNAIGKMVNLNTLFGPSDYEVTAVFDNSSILSHLAPSYIISIKNSPWAQLYNDFADDWVGNNLVFTYLELTEEADPVVVNEKIHQLLLTYGNEDLAATGITKTMTLQPVEDIHTTSGFTYDMPGSTDINLIKMPIAIGILILILACFNYVNLSTAQAGRRSLEIGIRKTLGVTSRGLRSQFLGESFILVFLSSIIGIILAELALPLFNSMVEIPVVIGLSNLANLAFFATGFLIFTALIAGFYPAIYLSGFKPVDALKGKRADSLSTGALRKVLVVIQFIISIVLISAIIIISQQVDYLEKKDLGFSTEAKLVIPLRTEETKAGYKALKENYTSLAAVNDVSGIDFLPGSFMPLEIRFYREGKSQEDAVPIYANAIDLNFPQLMDVELVGGNYFTDYKSDSDIGDELLLNRLAAAQLGLSPEAAVNEILYWNNNNQDDVSKFRVVGVLENINHFSLHDGLAPMAYLLRSNTGNIIVDANMADLPSLTANLERIWKTLIDSTPFEYITLDDHINLQYAKDYNTFRLIKSFALISLIISCMGLYALSMFVAERRFKEIGIRKAHGASVRDILILVSKELSILIIIAFAISIPISIYGMNKWLETFADRITPGIDTYLIAGTVSVLIGWVTISYQSIRAARANPINILHDE
jgi:putative ABC transport system permease protein